MASNTQQVLRNRANSMLSGFSTGQRMVVIIAAVAVVAGGVFFTQWASKPAMVPLFSNLSSDDASSITSKLQKSNVSYTLADGGGTILVPQSKVYQTRLDMAGEGLPNGGTSGYTLLDKQGITTSDFIEHVDYQRALEGELSKTIQSIDGVSAASVHLVMPQTDVFSDDAKKPTASVLIKNTGSDKLSSQQVTSIVNLVAGGVESLSPTDVSVTDDKGRSLAVAGQGVGGSGDTDQQSQATSALETDLNNKIQNMLTPVVGDGKAVVQSSASLNWDKVKSTTEQYNPDNKPVTPLSQSTKTETYGNGSGSGTATGCLGANATNSTLCQNATSTGGTSGPYSSSDVTQDNGVDKTATQTETTPGAVTRLSVAVILDSSAANVDTAKIQQLVTQAAGLQVSRGDSVTVERLAFDTAAASSAQKELKDAASAQKSAQTMGLIKTVATVLIIGAVLALLFLTTKKKAKNYTSTPISLAELDAAMPALPSADDMLASLDAASVIDNSPEALERAKVDKEITGLIERQPDEVASLLRSWLADRRG